MTLYLTVGSNYSKKDIVFGQMIGMGILIMISYIKAIGTKIIPTEYISLLGLLPIIIGIKEGIKIFKQDDDQILINDKLESNSIDKNGLITIIITAIACGTDNIGVYVPLFSKYSLEEISLFAIIFILLVPLLCFIAKSISDIPTLHKTFSKHQKYLVPIIFLLLGLYIIFK